MANPDHFYNRMAASLALCVKDEVVLDFIEDLDSAEHYITSCKNDPFYFTKLPGWLRTLDVLQEQIVDMRQLISNENVDTQMFDDYITHVRNVCRELELT